MIDPANLTIRIPRELVSPNFWNGRHWRVKHRLSQEWEHDIAWQVLANVKSVGISEALQAIRGPRWVEGYQPGRVRVAVTREVPSGRNFIRDDDNLRFAVKPLLDALKRTGYIRNDSRKWIDLPTPEQKVSSDGGYWTEIRIEAVS